MIHNDKDNFRDLVDRTASLAGFYAPLIEFIRTKMLAEGMIDEADVELICLTDDLEYVVKEIEKSLVSQIETLEQEGLKDTKYYQSLSTYIGDRCGVEGGSI